MAGEDQEKTEEATPKKIEDAKKDGNVPKSQDLSGFVTLVIAIGVLLAMLDIKELEYFVVDMVKKAKILKFRVDGKTQDIKTIYK
mgnify:CR=1 FL=1